jgi:hypothetical protein
VAVALVALLASGTGPDVLARDLGERAGARVQEAPAAAAAAAAQERRAERAREAHLRRAAERREAVRQVANGPTRGWSGRDLDAVRWRDAVPVGSPQRGALVRGVLLPARGTTYVTWDPVRRRTPNRADRRHATDHVVRAVLEVAAAHARAHPDAPRMVVGDLSRPHGGDFSARFGDLGDGQAHVSHQNGLDVDVYYPRADGRERGLRSGGPDTLCPLDRELAQDLVDRFVAAGAQMVIVGTRTGLTGPAGVVMREKRHNDHLHVRFAPR